MMYLLLLLSVPTLFAKSLFDFSYGMQGRTLPALGAEVYADSGYNLKIWGKKDDPKDVLYGLIRPSVSVSSKGVKDDCCPFILV